MITEKMIADAKAQISTFWNDDVISECEKHDSLNMGCKEFLSHCTACGGNWGGMLLSGLKKLRPTVWDIIPDNMGTQAWGCICSTLILCGIDTSDEGAI